MDTPDLTTLKRCTKCGELKSREQFTKDTIRKDGLRVHCRACTTKAARRYRDNDVEANRERQRRWRADHREVAKERQRRHYQVIREEVSEQRRLLRETNRDAINERKRAYNRSLNGNAVNKASNHNRRAHRSSNGGVLTTSDLATIRAAQTDKQGRLICWRCGNPIKSTPHLDHWIPLDKGGSNDPGNLHYMHARCNLTKHSKHPAEIGRLL